MIDISVVIPAYNAEKTVEKAILSISENFPKDISYEILLIDDGSTDSTKSICDHLSEYICSLHCIHQANGGVSSARNKGINESKGKYIMFLDADDSFLHDGMGCLNQYINSEFDAVFFSKNANNTLVIDASDLLIRGVLGGGEYANLHLECVLSKMYRKDLLTEYNIQFDNVIINGEDMIFNIEFLKRAKTVFLVNTSMYCYERNLQSSTNRFDIKIVDSEICFNTKLKNLIHGQSSELNERYVFSTVNGIAVLLQRISFTKECDLSLLNKVIFGADYQQALKSFEARNEKLFNRLIYGCIQHNRLSVCLSIYKLKNIVKKILYSIKNNKEIM